MATNSSNKPIVLEGGIAVDARGQVSFVNGFGFKDVVRFYMVENTAEEPIRAFHGHMKEAKYVFVPSGSALVAAVKLDDQKTPNALEIPERFVLSANKPSVLYIPGGYANGFRALEANTRVIFFATASVQESKADDYRFPHDYWGNDVWNVEGL
jgi:dTDP-4-dehydrorhamnose 3,5-epimerase-like enzyme